MWNYFNPVEIIFGENRFKEVHDSLKNKNYIIITHPEEIFKKAEFCSMCGPKHCPMNSKISDESLDELDNKLKECNTSV